MGTTAADSTVPSTSLATSPSTNATTTTTSAPEGDACDPTVPQTCTLRELADDAGILLGAAVAGGPLAEDPTYAEVLAAEFNSVTPENAFKWPATEPEPGVYTWNKADAIAASAERNDLAVRGHTLVWANSQSAELYEVLPSCVRDAPNEAALQQAVDDHIAAIVERSGEVTDRWDVVNEPLTLAEGELDPNALTETLGEAWMVRAFEQTRALDPDAKLYLNEVLTERPGEKHDALLALVGRLACLAVDACVEVTMWGVTDRYTWLDAFLGPGSDPLLFDENYEPKPAHRALATVLAGTVP